MSEESVEFENEVATESVADQLGLDTLDEQIRSRKRGHVTLENVYVVALVSAWASAVLLCLLLGSALFFTFIVPPELGITLIRGYNFFQSVSNGYNTGLQSLPASRRSAGGSMEYVISEYVQWFYSTPWQQISQNMDSDEIEEKMRFAASGPHYIHFAREMIWFICSKLRRIPVIGSFLPPEYYFPTYNHDYASVQLSSDEWLAMDIDPSILGEYTPLSLFFPTHFVKTVAVSDSQSIDYLLFQNDYYWNLFQIDKFHFGMAQQNFAFFNDYLFDTMAIFRNGFDTNFSNNDLNVSAHITISEVSFMHPRLQSNIVLTQQNDDDFLIFADDHFELRYFSNYTRWQLIEKRSDNNLILDTFEFVTPFVFGQWPQKRTYHNAISQIIARTLIVECSDADATGVYSWDETGWHTFGKKFNLGSDIEDRTTWLKTGDNINSQNTIFQLRHSTPNYWIHDWRLDKTDIKPMYRSRQSTNLTFSLEAVQWVNYSNPQSSQPINVKSGMKRATLQSPYIRSVIIEYILNNKLYIASQLKDNRDANVYRQLLCQPFVMLKSDDIYFKLRTPIDSVDLIPVDIGSITLKQLQCTELTDNIDNQLYLGGLPSLLSLDGANIQTDTFGGKTSARINIVFNNQKTCLNFVDQLTRQSTDNSDDRYDLLSMFIWRLIADPSIRTGSSLQTACSKGIQAACEYTIKAKDACAKGSTVACNIANKAKDTANEGINVAASWFQEFMEMSQAVFGH